MVRLRTAGCAPGVAFEEAVRRAASDVAEHLRSGLRVALHTDCDRLPATATARRIGAVSSRTSRSSRRRRRPAAGDAA